MFSYQMKALESRNQNVPTFQMRLLWSAQRDKTFKKLKTGNRMYFFDFMFRSIGIKIIVS